VGEPPRKLSRRKLGAKLKGAAEEEKYVSGHFLLLLVRGASIRADFLSSLPLLLLRRLRGSERISVSSSALFLLDDLMSSCSTVMRPSHRNISPPSLANSKHSRHLHRQRIPKVDSSVLQIRKQKLRSTRFKWSVASEDETSSLTEERENVIRWNNFEIRRVDQVLEVKFAVRGEGKEVRYANICKTG